MANGKRSEWGWAYSPRSAGSQKIPDGLKAEVTERAQALIEEWKPLCVKEPPKGHRFNYIVDLYTKWHGNSLYFCATYACPGPTAISPSFESRFTRMAYAGDKRFDLAFMRYTGKWVTVEHGLTLDECLKSIREDPFYQPS
jgi:hypothetical protein